MGRRLSQPYATPSPNSSLDYRLSDARIVENGFATSGSLRALCQLLVEYQFFGQPEAVAFFEVTGGGSELTDALVDRSARHRAALSPP